MLLSRSKFISVLPNGCFESQAFLFVARATRRTACGSRTQVLEFHEPPTHGSELVPIGIAHVGDIEVFAVVGAQARRSFGLTAVRKRGGVKRLHLEPGAGLPHEMKEGQLKTGTGKKVTSRKQAVAIGLSEAREAGGNAVRRRWSCCPSAGRSWDWTNLIQRMSCHSRRIRLPHGLW